MFWLLLHVQLTNEDKKATENNLKQHVQSFLSFSGDGVFWVALSSFSLQLWWVSPLRLTFAIWCDVSQFAKKMKLHKCLKAIDNVANNIFFSISYLSEWVFIITSKFVVVLNLSWAQLLTLQLNSILSHSNPQYWGKWN